MPSERSRTSFEMMALMFDIRNLLRPRSRILENIGLEKGMKVLDYGCGPGGYVKPTMKFIGPEGYYYAVDVHPRAERYVKKVAKTNKFENVEFILTDCCTDLDDSCIDMGYLFDIYHDLKDPEPIIREIKRVLKKKGRLAMNDHHYGMEGLKKEEPIKEHFKLDRENKYTLLFKKK
ncbi:MAG: methyltransferase domain-containing protein [Thermoplasmatota archaeon]